MLEENAVREHSDRGGKVKEKPNTINATRLPTPLKVEAFVLRQGARHRATSRARGLISLALNIWWNRLKDDRHRTFSIPTVSDHVSHEVSEPQARDER
jgi:hypothetical protein